MNVEVGTEAAQFPEKEYINEILVAVCVQFANFSKVHTLHLWSTFTKIKKTPFKIFLRILFCIPFRSQCYLNRPFLGLRKPKTYSVVYSR